MKTPWGAGFDFTNPTVRLFFLENVRQWLEDYDMDGLRFDAVHEFGTEAAGTFMSELAAMARAIKPNALLALENLDNDVEWLERDEAGRPHHFDAQWNDDIHHVLHVIATEQKSGYYRDFAEDTVDKARRALAEGFAYQGDAVPRWGDIDARRAVRPLCRHRPSCRSSRTTTRSATSPTGGGWPSISMPSGSTSCISS